MNNNIDIERAIIASVLNFEEHADINPDYFFHPLHKKLAIGYNRLKELGETIDFEILKNKFIKAKKWSMQEDDEFTFIMTHTTPFKTQELFNAYYKILEDNYRYSFDRRLAI